MKIEGIIYLEGTTKFGEKVFYGGLTSFDLHTDNTLINKALMFKDASRRDGRIFICTLVPKWKGFFLRMLRIKYNEN